MSGGPGQVRLHLPWACCSLVAAKGGAMQKLAGMLIGLLSVIILLAGCNPDMPQPPVPAGAELGLNTFVYFYSDN